MTETATATAPARKRAPAKKAAKGKAKATKKHAASEGTRIPRSGIPGAGTKTNPTVVKNHTFREGSKSAKVLGLLKEGVTAAKLEKVSGWKATSVAAFLSDLRYKYGYKVEASGERGAQTYRLK